MTSNHAIVEEILSYQFFIQKKSLYNSVPLWGFPLAVSFCYSLVHSREYNLEYRTLKTFNVDEISISFIFLSESYLF